MLAYFLEHNPKRGKDQPLPVGEREPGKRDQPKWTGKGALHLLPEKRWKRHKELGNQKTLRERGRIKKILRGKALISNFLRGRGRNK